MTAFARSQAPLPQWRALWHEWGLYLATHPVLFPTAEVARRLGDVIRLPVIGRVVNDPEVARAIFQRDRHFTKTGPGSMGPLYTQVLGPAALLNMDGPAHRTLRRKLTDLFAAPAAEALTEEVFGPHLHALRARLDAGEVVDLVAITRELTGRMTCHLVGIVPPPGEEAAVAQRVTALAERLTTFVTLSTGPLTPARVAAIRAPVEELTDTARASYDDPTLPPEAIIRRLREAGLAFDEVRGVLAALFLVGTQTVSVALPRIVALLLDTGQFERLRREPALLAGAIDEGLRCTAPTPATMRATMAETTVGRHRFRAGERVLILTYNIAKSARYFPHPWRFEITRQHDPAVRHLWFGAGPHFCLGFALAQAELRALLTTLLATEDELAITGRAASRAFLPGYRRLLIRARQAG